MSPGAEQAAMAAALRAAQQGARGANPLVGAALLDPDGQILALEHHPGAGAAHAETRVIHAAQQRGADLRTATLVITLEPCAHHGRTGPCVEAVMAAGIPRVVIAEEDVTAARGGVQALRAAGVCVQIGLCREQAHAMNRRWWKAQEEGRPWVTGKIASSLDGRAAAADGTSQWITGPQARAHGHRLRARADAVLVGTGTVLADDPRLDARDHQGSPLSSQPLRAVMGTRPVPEDARVRHGPGFLQLRDRDPRQALERLCRVGDELGRSVGQVLIEGGPRLLGLFLRCDLLDELYWYTAPTLLGDGQAAVAELGIGSLSEASHWRLDSAGSAADSTQEGLARLGVDVLHHLQPAARQNGI